MIALKLNLTDLKLTNKNNKKMIYRQLFPTSDYKDIDALMKNADKNFEELKRIDSEQPEESILYRYFNEQYADGYITYQVIKVNKVTCHIQACEGINLDEWKKGTFSCRIGYAESKIKQRLAMEKLFSKK